MTEKALSQVLDQTIPIEVVGCDLDGMQFIEPAKTLSITSDGAFVMLQNKLAPESELVVRNLQTGKECLARVVGMIKGSTQGHVYGIAIRDGLQNLWAAQFPPDAAGKTILPLKCGVCHAVLSVSLLAIEREIFQANKELARPCKSCNAVTIWKQTDEQVTDTWPSAPPALGTRDKKLKETATAKKEKRTAKRANIKSNACIRYSGIETTVACEDMSRGGFRFRSKKMYPQDLRMEASVPYAKSSVNIFTPARIIYCQELAEGDYRHGVAYIKSTMPPEWER